MLRMFALTALVYSFTVLAPGAIGQAPPSDEVHEGLSASDWSGIKAAHETGRHAAHPVEGGWWARNPGQQWQTLFDGRGFITTPDTGGWIWGLKLERYGFAAQERSVTHPARVKAVGQHVAYDWDDTLREWYVNDSRGLEHGYTVHRRPPHHEGDEPGLLTFALAVRGELVPDVTGEGRGVRFLHCDGAVVLTYSGLVVFDADGQILPARFESVAGGLLLTIDERGAHYPLTIDPIAQQAYLKASNTGATDRFGWSVAMSGDTAVVGAPFEDSNATGVDGDQADNSLTNSGAAYVFVRTGTSWSQQAYLKASNPDVDDRFGTSVAVSGDTVVVGAFLEDSSATDVDGDQGSNGSPDAGAAYTFVRSGTSWSQQAYLKASNTGAGDQFGRSVAASGDTVVVGSWWEDSDATGVGGNQGNDGATNSGATYVYARNGATWTQQAYLKASNTEVSDRFGSSVAVSGNTAMVGAATEDSGATGVDGNQADNSTGSSGAAYVFVRSGMTWTQQAYLKASNTGVSDQFGESVAMSGNTAVIGAVGESSNATGVDGDQGNDLASGSGAAYVFIRSGSTWSQQAYLKASNTGLGDQFGFSVGVSADTVVVGANKEDGGATGVNGDPTDNSLSEAGAAYVFARNGTTWSQQAYLKATNAGMSDEFGGSVTVSNDTVLVSAWLESSDATGVDGDQGNDLAPDSGATYVFHAPPGQLPASSPFIGALDGRGERATLGLPPPSNGDEFIPKPFVVVPIPADASVAVQVATIAEDTSLVSWGSPSQGFGDDFGTGSEPVMAGQDDFDEDGGDDVLTANRGADSVSLLLSDETPGAQAFLPQTEIPLGTDTAPVAVATGDFNGDMDADFAAAGASGVTAFLASSPGVFGAGSFTAVNSPDPSLHTDLAVGDFDADTDLDLVTSSGALAAVGPLVEAGFVTVLQNDGFGGFTVQATLPIGQAVASVLAGDFDDTDLAGRDDLLIAVHEFDGGPGGEPQARLELWISNGGGAFTLSPTAFGDDDGNGIPDNEIFDTDGVVPTFGALGDIDNDGDLDAVYTSRDNIAHAAGAFGNEYPPVELTVLMNDGTGHFAVSTVATAYAGKGISPILQDMAPLTPEPGGPFLDAVLIWFQDKAAGGGALAGDQTLVTALVWDPVLGTFVDASPNQFLSGQEPGNGAAGNLTNGAEVAGASGGGSGSPQLGPPPEIVVPNMLSNTLSVFGPDGEGGLVLLALAGPVDDTDPELTYPLGTWEGGPREARLVDVNADGNLDAVVFNSWDDITQTQAEVPSSVSVFLGDGAGELLRTDFVPLARGGEMLVGQLDSDGFGDVVVTQRLGTGGNNQVLGFSGNSSGVLSVTFVATVPSSTTLSGGIALIDADYDGEMDVVMAGAEGTGPGSARLVVVRNILTSPTAPTVTVLPSAGEWGAVRSMETGDVDGDDVPDILLGAVDGRLFQLAADPTSVPLLFNVTPLGITSGSVGGGAIRLGDITGDGILDIVSSGVSNSSQLDQAYVRTLRGSGSGSFYVEVLDGLSSFGVKGSLRPILADIDGDGALDTVLTHGGTAGTVSVHLNPLNAFKAYGSGVASSDGFTPVLEGFGYTTPGGQIDLVLSDVPAGVPAILYPSGEGAPDLNEAIRMLTAGFGIPLVVPGPPGTAGSLTLSSTLPDDFTLVGQQTTLRLLLLEPLPGGHGGGGQAIGARAQSKSGVSPTGGISAGPPPPTAGGFSYSNALRMTIVDGS